MTYTFNYRFVYRAFFSRTVYHFGRYIAVWDGMNRTLYKFENEELAHNNRRVIVCAIGRNNFSRFLGGKK